MSNKRHREFFDKTRPRDIPPEDWPHKQREAGYLEIVGNSYNGEYSKSLFRCRLNKDHAGNHDHYGHEWDGPIVRQW